jgi:hypothetical protein
MLLGGYRCRSGLGIASRGDTDRTILQIGVAMNYANGEQARLGDHVSLGEVEGTVVISFDTEEYAASQPKSQWAYLKRGILVEFPLYGLIHYEEAERDLHLIERASLSNIP